jgi:hypothetical protein
MRGRCVASSDFLIRLSPHELASGPASRFVKRTLITGDEPGSAPCWAGALFGGARYVAGRERDGLR